MLSGGGWQLDISNKTSFLAAIFLNIGSVGLNSLGIQVAAWPLLFFSILGIVFVFIDNHFKNKSKELYATARQESDDPQKVLPPNALDMLRVIAATEQPFNKNRSKATINEVSLSETFGISHQKTKYLLESLERAGMFKIDKGVGIYGISHDGRELLSKKERLP